MWCSPLVQQTKSERADRSFFQWLGSIPILHKTSSQNFTPLRLILSEQQQNMSIRRQDGGTRCKNLWFDNACNLPARTHTAQAAAAAKKATLEQLFKSNLVDETPHTLYHRRSLRSASICIERKCAVLLERTEYMRCMTLTWC